jgi:hypothetical protein
VGEDHHPSLHQALIAELGESVAALARQLDRAAVAYDEIAVCVERLAICIRVRNLVHQHFQIVATKEADEDVFVYGLYDGWVVERAVPRDLAASGQFWCSGPRGVFEDWLEPFAAHFRLTEGSAAVAAYSIRFGRRSTFQTLAAIRTGIAAGNPPPPCPPSEVSEWAYVFSGPAEHGVTPDPRRQVGA